VCAEDILRGWMEEHELAATKEELAYQRGGAAWHRVRAEAHRRAAEVLLGELEG
jgi:hypothetical protein